MAPLYSQLLSFASHSCMPPDVHFFVFSSLLMTSLVSALFPLLAVKEGARLFEEKDSSTREFLQNMMYYVLCWGCHPGSVMHFFDNAFIIDNALRQLCIV
jgi:hypothetical protein